MVPGKSHVEIGIKFLERDLEAAIFEEGARSAAAAVKPLPSELTTPPVSKYKLHI